MVSPGFQHLLDEALHLLSSGAALVVKDTPPLLGLFKVGHVATRTQRRQWRVMKRLVSLSEHGWDLREV